MNNDTALQLARRIANRELSVTEATEAALAAAHADELGAYTFIADEDALATAAELDRRLVAGETPGPLFGVPCPVKDLAQVAGWPFEAGSVAFAGNRAEVDSGIVTRLREAGLVLIGKTATPEFGLPCYTEPVGRTPASTPFDRRRGAGGSSGGAGAAVAGGSVPIAHGSDGGGSIRIPAAACGLVGLKATRGRVSLGPIGVDGPGLVSEGVLTRDVADTAAALNALAPGWPGDPYPAGPVPDFLAGLGKPGRLRIGVLTDPVIVDQAPVHPEALAAVRRTIGLLEELGHQVGAAPRPFGEAEWAAFTALWSVGALGVPVPEELESSLRPLTRWLRGLGRETSGQAYAAALTAAQRTTRNTALAWDEFDAVLTPTLAQPPAVHGELCDEQDPAGDFTAQCRFTPWTSIANLTGRPSLTLPLHTADVDGTTLPFGVLLTGRWGEDGLLLALGAQLEAANGGWPTPGE
ncbi:amidase [Naumannella sp. ID2617S]|nr:amidase [Naumannella sp. ID2617S]